LLWAHLAATSIAKIHQGTLLEQELREEEFVIFIPELFPQKLKLLFLEN